MSSVDSPQRNSFILGFKLTSSFASMKKNLSFAVVTPALPNAASTRLIHVWIFFLSNGGSSTFLTVWLAAAMATAAASGVAAGRMAAANSFAAAWADAVAIRIMSSIEGLPGVAMAGVVEGCGNTKRSWEVGEGDGLRRVVWSARWWRVSGADKLLARDRVTAPSVRSSFVDSSAELSSSGSALLDKKLGRNLSMDRCWMGWLGERGKERYSRR